MKSVMLSIKPQYCELIVIGAKTVEVRKTRPKLDVPFKCYIYKTKDKYRDIFHKNTIGKVIGEFICDKIGTIEYSPLGYMYNKFNLEIEKPCLSFNETYYYLNGKKGYAWHISDLVIYDKPKELSEFYRWKKCNSCKASGYESTACIYDIDCKVPVYLERPPQSWCYVEELK